VRAETLIIQEESTLTTLDTAKQLGYLVGMGGSWLFYKILENYSITDSQTKVYELHYLLLGMEVIIILLIVKSFTNERI
jgi:hypothetical protein